jgi:hypothetical protein
MWEAEVAGKGPAPGKTKAKKDQGITQIVESLPNKCEALSSNPNTTRNMILVTTQNYCVFCF